MRYLVYFEIPAEVGNRLDFEEGGAWANHRICHGSVRARGVIHTGRPALCFHSGRLDEAQMTELILVVSEKFDTYPEFTPVIPLAVTPSIAAKAIEEAKKAP